jgi:hypothetical protein
MNSFGLVLNLLQKICVKIRKEMEKVKEEKNISKYVIKSIPGPCHSGPAQHLPSAYSPGLTIAPQPNTYRDPLY